MESSLRFISFLLCLPWIRTQKFGEESPYLRVRLMDVKQNQWKTDTLKIFEQPVDAELKYTDERKGVPCISVEFEQEPGYPKQDARFLDLSIRGTCIDESGRRHKIEKDLITKAIIREKDAVNAAIAGVVFSIGNIQLYERNRNRLNLVIVPISIGFVTMLFILTFFLRRLRYLQKRAHIISELQKKRELTQKKVQTMPNIDPQANDKQRLLELDPTVVGNVSQRMGSSKEFTNNQYAVVNRNNSFQPIGSRQNEIPPPIPSKENRAPYYKREDEIPFQAQKSSRERIQLPLESESRFSPNHHQYQQDSQQIPMVSMQNHQPRVVVRSIRDDGSFSPFYPKQHDESSSSFVSIPVQIEESVTHQRFMTPPYHSDPYYPYMNS